MTVYGGSQPSLVRAALSQVPGLDRCSFVDLGCGKGRPLLVASEYPFRDIVGVELSADLAQIARRNAEVVAERYPARTPIRVEEGDATEFRLPDGDLVVFLYNPFGAPLVAKVVQRVEEALARDPQRRLFVVLYNPVNGALFDASAGLTRRFAAMLDYATEELGFGPDLSDAIMIWQGGSVAAPPAAVPARIVITNAGSRAELSG
jgi:SAM-dependent methyltransferase